MLRYEEIRDSCKQKLFERYHVLNEHRALDSSADLSLEQVVMDCAMMKRDFSEQTNEDYGLALHLLQRMLDFDPQHRITAFEALCHPFFKSSRSELKDSCHLWHFSGDSSIFSNDNFATFASDTCPGEFS
eukprot:TRINITY_DN2331_c0_g1_i4.p2 TRINITY_DN2331_c0_g1~~TRINITY_DN2331_c0_g1_i4.p2  ORF type:complete len:130 (-),score=26.27 TRINITY_DN2331_c0_g1_i4:26-415(-)